MVQLIKDETRKTLQSLLEKFIKENSEIQKAAVLKITDAMIYAQVNFKRDELEKFALPLARAFAGSIAASKAVGRILEKLQLPNGITAVFAGTTTLLAVVIDPERNQRSMSEGINRKIDKTAELIKEIMG